MKLLNLQLKNRILITSKGNFEFDGEGTSDIPDEVAKGLLTLANYSEYKGKNSSVKEKKEDEPINIPSKEEKQDIDEISSDKEETKHYTREELEEKNVLQLKKIAKELDVDLDGKSKKDDIIDAILG